MKGLARLLIAGGVSLSVLLLFAPAAQAQLSGAYYWGDADANGVIEVPDMIALNTVLGNPASDDLLTYTGYPQSRYRQELDGNGVIEIPDLIVLNGWVPGDFSNRPGNPDRLVLDASSVSVAIGFTVVATAYALSPVSQGSQVRTGFGVIWKQIPGQTTCPTAQVYGYNVFGGATVNAWRTSAYHYTLFPGAPDNGRVSMKVRGNACSGGQITTYEVYIPDDIEAGVVPGRFPSKLNASLPLKIRWAGASPQCNTITVLPGSTNLLEGNSIQMRAVCTLTDATTVNCTDNCKGVSTIWGSTGDLFGLFTKAKFQAKQVPCWAGGHGTVKALFGTTVSLGAGVTVVNDDVAVSVSVNPTSAVERQSGLAYRLTMTCSDGNTQNVTAFSTVSPPGVCNGGNGTVNIAEWTCGSDKPPLDCTITETISGTGKNTNLIVNNDPTDAITGFDCTINSATEQGATVSLGCVYSWNNQEGYCNTSTDNASVDAVIGGANCNKPNGTSAQCLSWECSSANWWCTINTPKTIQTHNFTCIDDGDTVLNGSTILTPAGPVPVGLGSTQVFGGSIRWSEACAQNTCPTATFSLVPPAGCGTWNGPTCTYTAPPVGVCIARLSASYHSVSDGTTIVVSPCCGKPVIGSIFPFDFPARFTGNGHTDQGITLLFNTTVGSGGLTDISMTCTPTAGPLVVFTVANCPVAAYPDVTCTPPSNFQPLMQYGCTITATNSNGSTVSSSKTFTTGTAAAPATPAVGGLGGGYIGGNSYSRYTGVSGGNVSIQLVDMDTRQNVNGKAYIQIVQGSTITERFTNASGLVTITNVLPLSINAITAGLKCGTARCDLNNRANNYSNYMYQTWQNIDARDMVLRMKLMTNSEGYINTWNTTRQGRYRADVFGTIPPANLSTFIAPLDRTAASIPQSAILFSKPTHLRAGLALFASRNIYDVTTLLDTLAASGDSETSISICLSTMSRNGTRGWGIVKSIPLPPFLVLPELVRIDWNRACGVFSTYPGKYQFKAWNWVPGQTMPLMVIGAYFNTSNISLYTLFEGTDLSASLFSYPLYVTGVGYHNIAPLATWTAPAADLALHMGNLGFELDMRERWVAPDQQSPGYDPDPSVDKRITISVQPILPIDPARVNSLQSADTAWFIAGRRVPNADESQLTSKWGTTYGVGGATWDDRFVRNSAIIAAGAHAGFASGFNIFGLQLNTRIDDSNFTTFESGYVASASQGLWVVRVGSSQWRYWNNSVVDTERFGREMTFVPSNAAGDVTIPWSQPTEGGGSVNYAGLVALVRGLSVSSPKVTPRRTDGTPSTENMGLHGNGPVTYKESGFSLRVFHIGPINSYTQTITANGQTTKAYFVERFLNMPEAISPSPDTYYYPAPQWSATYRISLPVNRNGELRRVFTYGTKASKYIQRTGGNPNRRYLKFTVPGFVPASASDVPDTWLATVATEPSGLWSAKRGVHDTDASMVTTTQFQDLDARFINQGVTAGNHVYMNKGATVFNTAIVISVTQTTITLSAAAPWPAGANYIEYSIARTAGLTGECYVDPWYGGDAPDRQGGACKNISLWSLYGPIPAGATSVSAYLANITPGAATLSGVTGYVPDAWEGIPASTLWGAGWYSPPRLKWTYGIINVNSGTIGTGGLGGPLDWNNQNFWQAEFAVNMFATDEGVFLMNFAQ